MCWTVARPNWFVVARLGLFFKLGKSFRGTLPALGNELDSDSEEILARTALLGYCRAGGRSAGLLRQTQLRDRASDSREGVVKGRRIIGRKVETGAVGSGSTIAHDAFRM